MPAGHLSAIGPRLCQEHILSSRTQVHYGALRLPCFRQQRAVCSRAGSSPVKCSTSAQFSGVASSAEMTHQQDLKEQQRVSRSVRAVTATALKLWQGLLQPFNFALAALQSKSQRVNWKSLQAVAAQCSRTAKKTHIVLAAAPVAAQGSSYTLLLLTRAMAKFVEWYLLLLFVRVLLSWFPTFDWDQQPWLAIRQLTDPYLNLFRNIIPPLLGMMDFTPLLGFIILQNLQGYLAALSAGPDQDMW